MSATLIWTIILVIAVIIEAITVDIVSIWFALGALIALILDFLGLSTFIQVLAFALVSIVCILTVRPISKKYLKTNTIKTNYDRVIGEHCLVTETITPDQKGEVKVLGSLWMASSLNNETIQVGEYAEVVSIEGAHVIVKKLIKGDEL
ncbi:MAG: NfeD family protein [Thomasclavelia sp.]|jgi:membrane protein implicated in regulation of membrane protease activity|nr:NfeD family protein [Thomasclavelia sp.]